MQYLLLIYGDESPGSEMTPEQMEGSMGEWYEYSDWLEQQGWVKGGDALLPTDQATSVRVRDGERSVTDGPFAETKEQLGGYYLLDVANLDDAIEAAARCPGARTGTIELRPVMELPARPA